MSEWPCGSSLVSIVGVAVEHMHTLLPAAASAKQQELCHEFSHDIEREQTVLAAAEEAENGLVYSGLDEIVQPLGAMPRGSRNAEGLDRFVGDQRRGSCDISAGDGGNHRLLIDGNAGGIDIGGEKLVAHHKCEFLPDGVDGLPGIVRDAEKQISGAAECREVASILGGALGTKRDRLSHRLGRQSRRQHTTTAAGARKWQ